MGFFDWAAPIIRRYGDRFTPDDAERIAAWIGGAVTPGGHVLDVGGGAGQLAALLAARLDAHVTVLDPTANMLAHVPESRRLTALAGTAETIPCADSEIDAIVVTDAFHHFRDQDAAVREFVRVVRPGGRVLILDLDPRPFGMRLVVLGEKILGEPGAFMTPDEMCAFMGARGIEGRCERLAGAGYYFLGSVAKPRDAA